MNVGLPWLKVCLPGHTPSHDQAVPLEERFGINDGAGISHNAKKSENERVNSKPPNRPIYPSHLRHHEPLSFLKTGLLCPILDKFTFTVSQLHLVIVVVLGLLKIAIFPHGGMD